MIYATSILCASLFSRSTYTRKTISDLEIKMLSSNQIPCWKVRQCNIEFADSGFFRLKKSWTTCSQAIECPKKRRFNKSGSDTWLLYWQEIMFMHVSWRHHWHKLLRLHTIDVVSFCINDDAFYTSLAELGSCSRQNSNPLKSIATGSSLEWCLLLHHNFMREWRAWTSVEIDFEQHGFYSISCQEKSKPLGISLKRP